MPLPERVALGIEQFNRREFFEAHETIEAEWMIAGDDLRELYQGIIQVAVACHHAEEGNWRGARSVLSRATPKLGKYLPACQGIDVAELLAQVQRLSAELDRLDPPGVGRLETAIFPVIRFVKHEA